MSISGATDTIFQLSQIEHSGLSEANMTWERGRCLVRGWTEMSGGAQNEPEAPSTTLSFPREPSPLKRCTSMTAPQDAQRWDGRWPDRGRINASGGTAWTQHKAVPPVGGSGQATPPDTWQSPLINSLGIPTYLSYICQLSEYSRNGAQSHWQWVGQNKWIWGQLYTKLIHKLQMIPAYLLMTN